MRLTFDPRMRRLVAALPRTSLYAVSELVLLTVLAWQIARLFWAIVTPVSPLGDWRAVADAPAIAAPGILGSFDPFNRLSGEAGVAAVTDLDLKLFGVRADQATGRGSAIIGLPDGHQTSVAIGEEIVPGTTLQAVAMDSVTILRGGARQMLYLDQSQPVTTVAPTLATLGIAPQAGATGAPAASGINPATLAAQIGASPRVQGGRIDGFTLQPRGDGEAFRAAGLQAGDVLLSVNGVRVLNAEALAMLPQVVGSAPQVALEIERGGRATTLSVSLSR